MRESLSRSDNFVPVLQEHSVVLLVLVPISRALIPPVLEVLVQNDAGAGTVDTTQNLMLASSP